MGPSPTGRLHTGDIPRVAYANGAALSLGKKKNVTVMAYLNRCRGGLN